MRNTLLVLASMSLVIGLINAAIVPPPRTLASSRKGFTKKTWIDPMFLVVAAGSLLSVMALNVPNNFGPEFAEAIKFEQHTASLTLVVFGGAGFAARFCWGYLKDECGSQNSMVIVYLVPVLLTYMMWLPCAENGQKGVWWAYMALYGVASEGHGVIDPSYLIDLFGSSIYYDMTAVVNLLRGVGSLIGLPLGGKILGNKVSMVGLDFGLLAIFVGTIYAVALVSVVAVRTLYGKKKGWKWLV